MRPLLAPAALALLAGAPVAARAESAPVTVTVSGIRSDAGRVHVDVCPAASFLHACPYSATVAAHRGAVEVTVQGVPPGRYAIQAFHDANANGDLDRGIFGIPKEGIGFSNDAMSHLVRPKFDVAAFEHGPQAQHMAVMLRYFLG